METVPVYEIKNKFSEYADRAAMGEEIMVTKRRKPFVKITSIHETRSPAFRKRTSQEAFQSLMDLRDSGAFTLPSGLSAKDLIEEGRK